jgi:hypothetical protein
VEPDSTSSERAQIRQVPLLLMLARLKIYANLGSIRLDTVSGVDHDVTCGSIVGQF